MRWAGHVTCLGEEKCIQDSDGKKLKKGHSEYLDTDGRIILQCILQKLNVTVWLRIVTSGNHFCKLD
jgi:hypothetical protein